MAENSWNWTSPPEINIHKSQINAATITSLKKRGQMYPPYLILQKQSRILNMSNPVACVFDNIGS